MKSNKCICVDFYGDGKFVKTYESKEAERIAFLKMWCDMLNGMMSDFLLGIATATTDIPKGELTAENIMRNGIKYSVERFVASDPPEGKLTPIEASRYFFGKHMNECKDKWTEKIFYGDWVEIEQIDDEIVIIWKPQVCSFQAHCIALKKDGKPCICPRRLYHEEMIREMAQEDYQSKLELCDPAGRGCRFKLFQKT